MRFAEQVQATHRLSIVTADPTDNRILECADAGKVDYIVSGDAHLLQLEQYRGAPIMKVAEFLNRLRYASGG